MRNQIKKATGKVASLIKRIQNLNFKSEQEIIEIHNTYGWVDYYESRGLQKKFGYYFDLFELKEGLLWEEPTEKEAEQNKAIWRLVKFEEGLNE